MRDRQETTDARIIRNLSDRIRKLEARLTQVIDNRRPPLFFSISGPLVDQIGVESEQMRTVWPTEIDLIAPDVLVAPSGADVTIDLTLYGPTTGVIRTVTIPDGFTYVEDAVPFIIPAGGRLTATVTAADSGTASDLSIALIPRLL